MTFWPQRKAFFQKWTAGMAFLHCGKEKNSGWLNDGFLSIPLPQISPAHSALPKAAWIEVDQMLCLPGNCLCDLCSFLALNIYMYLFTVRKAAMQNQEPILTWVLPHRSPVFHSLGLAVFTLTFLVFFSGFSSIVEREAFGEPGAHRGPPRKICSSSSHQCCDRCYHLLLEEDASCSASLLF